LVLLLAERLAALTWLLFPEPDLPVPDLPGGVMVTVGAGEDSGRGYREIASWHLFGQLAVKAEKPKEKVEAPENVPETKLQMTLRGVYHTSDLKLARAIVAGRDSREGVYAVGDSLPGGVTLEEIEPRRIVLSRQGRFEALSFPEAKNPGGVQVSLSRRQPVGSSTEPTQSVDVVALAERYRKAVASDPTALADIAQVQPFIEQGTFRGFRLRPGRKRNLLRQLGLRSGDIVTSVNGVPLDSMSQAMDSLRMLGDASQIDLTVLRDGREVPFSFRLN
jgi:general secretion pathway protein C